MSNRSDVGVVVDVAFAIEFFVVDGRSDVASDPRQAADWRAFGLGGLAFGQLDPLAVALFVEERFDLFFF
jgi:hypothetical protein